MAFSRTKIRAGGNIITYAIEKDMTSKFLQRRWIENRDANRLLDKVKLLFKNGGLLKKELSPFGLVNGLIDFRGLDLSRQGIQKIEIENADLSQSNFSSAIVEKSIFENVKFDLVDFRDLTDRGNCFRTVMFFNCKHDRAALGYEGTQYVSCRFEKSSFVKSVFIRSEFVNTQFIDCKLKGVDFNASSFEDCRFVGKLEDVWFRGGYAFPSDVATFGKAKKNQMQNVSFTDATLEGVDFSNDCDLSTIKIPRTGSYLLFDKWPDRLERLKTIVKEWPTSQRKEAEIFLNSHLVHAKTQNWSIINIEELQEEFGIDLTSNIIIELNGKV